MPQSRRTRVRLLAAAILLLGVGSAAAEPLFTLSEDGKTFLYRARPGDLPGVVAEMFGIPARDVPAFLAANGITDATKVSAGFVYRIPNAPARDLGARLAALEAENTRLKQSAGDTEAKAERLARAAEDARAEKARAESRASQLARLERLWPWAKAALTLLLAAAAGALYTALAALRRRAEAERYTRGLVSELEEKRKAALAERQESARHILDLEQRIRTLETKLGPRVVGGRGTS
jgi:DNA repair exonuclease SbcCD ATPase subunit